MNTWAAVTGPIPNCWSSCGAAAVISSAMGVFSSAISLLRLRMRLAVERRACLVAVSSLTEAGGIRNGALGHQSSCAQTSELAKIDRRGYYQGF